MMNRRVEFVFSVPISGQSLAALDAKLSDVCSLISPRSVCSYPLPKTLHDSFERFDEEKAASLFSLPSIKGNQGVPTREEKVSRERISSSSTSNRSKSSSYSVSKTFHESVQRFDEELVATDPTPPMKSKVVSADNRKEIWRLSSSSVSSKRACSHSVPKKNFLNSVQHFGEESDSADPPPTKSKDDLTKKAKEITLQEISSKSSFSYSFPKTFHASVKRFDEELVSTDTPRIKSKDDPATKPEEKMSRERVFSFISSSSIYSHSVSGALHDSVQRFDEESVAPYLSSVKSKEDSIKKPEEKVSAERAFSFMSSSSTCSYSLSGTLHDSFQRFDEERVAPFADILTTKKSEQEIDTHPATAPAPATAIPDDECGDDDSLSSSATTATKTELASLRARLIACRSNLERRQRSFQRRERTHKRVMDRLGTSVDREVQAVTRARRLHVQSVSLRRQRAELRNETETYRWITEEERDWVDELGVHLKCLVERAARRKRAQFLKAVSTRRLAASTRSKSETASVGSADPVSRKVLFDLADDNSAGGRKPERVRLEKAF